MVVENVKGAQPWVGPARANFGSFYFWGDIQMHGGAVVAGKPQFGNVARAAKRTRKQAGRNFHFPDKYGIPSPSFHGADHEPSVAAALVLKTTGHANIRDGHSHTRHLTNQSESDSLKEHGTKQEGSGPEWFDTGIAKHSSRSDSRKAASAQIAKIPFPLSSYIARCFRPSGIEK